MQPVIPMCSKLIQSIVAKKDKSVADAKKDNTQRK